MDSTPDAPQRRALVIAHEPDGPARLVEYRLVERGFEVDTHVVTADMDKPNVAAPFPDFTNYDIVLPMGSVRSLTNKAEIDTWIYDELDRLREAHEADIAMLGICFGGQLLADALGGSVEVAPVTEMGWFEIQDAPGATNPVGPGPWKEWHHDRFTAPAEAEVLAVTENATQLFRLGRSVGTQFHPEVNVEHITDWTAQCTDEYLAEHGTTKTKLIADMAEHEAANIINANRLVDWFLDEVAFAD